MADSFLTRRIVLGGAVAVPLSALVPTAVSHADTRPHSVPITLPAVASAGSFAQPARIMPSTKIAVSVAGLDAEAAAALVRTGDLLAADLEALIGIRPKVSPGRKPSPHDISLSVGVQAHAASDEAHSLRTGATTAITGATPRAVFWGTQTLLQLVRSAPRLANGGVSITADIADAPVYGERAVMLDCGRKYFTAGWIKGLIREMAYLKLNTLQMHISDHLGFRVESELFPEIVSPEHLTKDEVRSIIAYARDHGVTVLLDIDSPAHFDHILKTHAQFALVLANGTRLGNAIDVTKQEAREFVKALLGEMMDLFGSPVVHIGGDEYLPAPWQAWDPNAIRNSSAPGLVAWAREVTGNPAAGALDAYVSYMNEIADFVRSKGAVARMWNDDIYPGQGVVRIDARTQADVWIRWNTSKPTAADFIRAGHSVMNANGDYLHFILTREGLGTGPHKNPRGIYERWNARRFMGAAGSASDFDLPAGQPMLGGHLSIWCDHPPIMTEAEVIALFQEWLQVFSQQMWGTPKLVPTLEALRSDVIEVVRTAPGIV